MYRFVKVENLNGVAIVSLNNPTQRNAWSPQMHTEVRAALEAAGQDRDVRVIVLTGEGRDFCVGRDVSELGATAGDRSGPVDPDPHNMHFMFDVPKPIIAAINGPTAGAGFCYAGFSDLRYVADGARITTAWSRRGLTAEFGMAWLLPHLVGVRNALDILMTGRVLSAAEADRMGFATVLPSEGFLDQVLALARDMADFASPLSTGVMKRQVYRSLFFTGVGEAVTDAVTEAERSFTTADFKEGIAHFVEKRAPAFTGQ